VGSFFHYLISALDLTAWADAFHDPATKRRSSAEIKAVSDKLRIGATEPEGRVPSREEFDRFICDQVKDLPHSGELAFVLCNAWRNTLDDHADEVARIQPIWIEKAHEFGTR